MSATRVFVARLAGLAVFDPLGDQVGRVRDVVVTIRPGPPAPRAVGMVVEVPGRRRVFMPMTRVTSIDAGQVITTGLVNMRRFEQRPTETLVLGELLDRTVTLRDEEGKVTIEDLAIEVTRARDWRLSRAYVRRMRAGRLRRRGEAFVVDIDQVSDLGIIEQRQGAANLLAAIEELPEETQVEILSELAGERAADVLEAMQPDDAADLLSELPPDQAGRLLDLMDPDEADDVRRLLAYADDTAGGLMTTEPVVLPPDAAIAEALAMVRRSELSPCIAAAVFVCRAPTETPTGKYLGMAHIQRMLREPPHEPVGSVIDRDVEPVRTGTRLDHVARHLATYNLVSVPVTDDEGRLVGAVTVDDVLDHLLPHDWREAGDDLDDHPGNHAVDHPRDRRNGHHPDGARGDAGAD